MDPTYPRSRELDIAHVSRRYFSLLCTSSEHHTVGCSARALVRRDQDHSSAAAAAAAAAAAFADAAIAAAALCYCCCWYCRRWRCSVNFLAPLVPARKHSAFSERQYDDIYVDSSIILLYSYSYHPHHKFNNVMLATVRP